MSRQLLEADFLTLDIQSLFGNKQAEGKPAAKDNGDTKDGSTKAGGNKAPSVKGASVSNKTNWDKELKRRLDDNKALDPESRESEFDIESRFWDDYFAANNYDPEVAEWLKTIDLLKKDFKTLGFNNKENPLVSFFKNKWVQTHLIKTKLINSNTYKAIHNALAKRYIADSEFLKSNNYNIIYCKDWYDKPLPDMVTYLAHQQKSLPPSGVSHYDEDRQNRNISIFLMPGTKSVKLASAKLKKLSEVEKLIAKIVDTSASGATSDSNATSAVDDKEVLVSSKELLKAIRGLTAAQCQAGLQYISILTNTEDARKALRASLQLNQPNAEEFVVASEQIAKIFKSGTITANNAAEIVEALLDRMKELR